MDEVDRIFRCVDGLRGSEATVIGCLYTGPDLPPHCAPMPRMPEPMSGMIFDDGFPSVLERAIERNPAVHDGAIMIGRPTGSLPYRVAGWSYRLFPPRGRSEAEPNRGSAFNSCLAMSSVGVIDRVYLISNVGVFRFEKGEVKRFETAVADQRLPAIRV